MEIFRRGSDPPSLIFGSYGTREAKFNFGHREAVGGKGSLTE